ncbi:MAG TPA: tetratricopeptide repeat protein [Blastocatellia bacterium]|nr:tetratricopeptide repeat protein [Blastocatellia bacterium]
MVRGVSIMRLSESILLIIILLTVDSMAAAQSNPNSAAAAFENGQNAQERGDLLSAIRYYTTAIEAEPALFQAYYQRGVALAQLGRAPDAEKDFRKVIELRPGFARAHRGLGQVLLDQGKTEEAMRELSRAVEMDPKMTGVRIYLASALIKRGQPASAAEHLRTAIDQGEADPLAFALLGVALERTGKVDEAFTVYSRAIEMDANNATAREGRGRILESRNETAKAIEDYAVAYRAQPSPDLALKLAEAYARAGQAQAAIQIYRSHLRERPDDFAVRAEMIRLMAAGGQSEEAQREIERLIQARPADAKLLALAGDLFLESKPELAASYYRRAMEADETNSHARVHLGAALVRSMRYDEAVALLSEIISKEPENYVAHANLATALFKLKQYPQAAREFIWIIERRPEIAASYYFLAISLDRIGDCLQATRAYKEFVRRAEPASLKNEVEEANIRLGLLQKLAKEGKCKSLIKGKGK